MEKTAGLILAALLVIASVYAANQSVALPTEGALGLQLLGGDVFRFRIWFKDGTGV